MTKRPEDEHNAKVIDIENAVLSSFLFANDMGENTDNAFILNTDIFTSSYRRAVAGKINDETNGDRCYGFLSVVLEEKTKGTAYEQELLDILSQTHIPFSVVKRYVDLLEMKYKERISKVFM